MCSVGEADFICRFVVG